MTFYDKLIYILYPEYIQPEIFIYPMKNNYSLFIQLALQKQKRLEMFYLINSTDKEKYYKLYNIQYNLAKFVTHVKYKYAKVYNDMNLYGDKLKKKCISVLENNKIYKYDFYEMIKLFKNKLYYHSYYFLMPMIPVNPYTNKSFEMHNLYNIFFQLLHSNYLIPIGIRVFFNVNFDLHQFIDNFSYNIKMDVLNSDYYNMPLEKNFYR